MKKVVLVVIIFLVAVASWWFLNGSPKGAPVEYDIPSEIILSHTYDATESLHRYRGVLSLPSECYEVEEETFVMESFPEQIAITLLINQSAADCPFTAVEREFIAEAQASEQATLTRLTVNGEQVNVVIE